MFGYALSEMRQHTADVGDKLFRFFVGAAFVVLAAASIQYEEQIAPGVERVSDAWSMATTDFSRRLNL